ncbi:protein EIN4-like [Solanum lycopersicum]|uniref:Signal transduction histidine kinase dimerisation/phosphoacceptor domain-containing protein n=1 Tax=Solanum lycopersicum TaxID=4081 RepID=A0A3Q7J9H9_SOLLC
MEIVEVVVDQVIVALSHATVLEELMREKLEARNGLQQQAKENVVKASHTRYSFQNLMNNGMKRPMHSILGLLSILQDENTSTNQKIIIDTTVRMSTVLLNLINDAMDIPDKDEGRFPVKMMSFQLHSLIREASCLVNCLCVYKGFRFSMDVPNSLTNLVMGDEKRR